MSLLSCGGGSESSESVPLSVSDEAITVETDHEITREFAWFSDEEPILEASDPTIIELTVGDGCFTVKGLEVGEAEVLFKDAGGDTLESISVEVIEALVYLPVPAGIIVIKGLGQTFTVKGVITDESVEGEPVWSVSDGSIVSFESQGLIAHFTSLQMGESVATLAYAGHDASFTVRVTNIRGD